MMIIIIIITIIITIKIYSNKWIREGFTVIHYKLYGLITYSGKIVQQSVAWFFNSGCHDCSTVTGTIDQQSLARLINSHWHDSLLEAGTIVQQPLAPLFKSHWHDCWTVTVTIAQQSLAWLFNSGWHDCSSVTGKIFSFFYAGRILQQWSSLLKNRAMCQEYDTWSQLLCYWQMI